MITKGVSEVKCPDFTCKAKIDANQLQQLLGLEDLVLLLNRDLDKNEKYMRCPTCNIGFIFEGNATHV